MKYYLKYVRNFKAPVISIFLVWLLGSCGEVHPISAEPQPVAKATVTPSPSLSPIPIITATPLTVPTSSPVILKNGTLTQVFPGLANLSMIDKLYLADDWDGDFGYRPLITHYSFTRRGNLFEVAVDFSSGLAQDRVQTTYNFSIQANIVENFLNNLEKFPVNEEKYVPVIQGAGSYDQVKFEAEHGGEKLSFFTGSSTANLAPWGLTYAGREFVVSSDLPTRALKELRPYLHRDVLANLIGITPGWCGPGFPCP